MGEVYRISERQYMMRFVNLGLIRRLAIIDFERLQPLFKEAAAPNKSNHLNLL